MPNTCYMCNSQTTSVEHVPPHCLFPEQKDLNPGLNLRKQLITVPSCDEHNSKKSHDDEYLLYVLVFNIPNNETAENHSRTKLFRAIQRNPNLAQMLSKENIPVSVVNNENGQFSNTYAFKVDNERLEDAREMVGRALYFHHNQIP